MFRSDSQENRARTRACRCCRSRACSNSGLRVPLGPAGAYLRKEHRHISVKKDSLCTNSTSNLMATVAQSTERPRRATGTLRRLSCAGAWPDSPAGQCPPRGTPAHPVRRLLAPPLPEDPNGRTFPSLGGPDRPATLILAPATMSHLTIEGSPCSTGGAVGEQGGPPNHAGLALRVPPTTRPCSSRGHASRQRAPLPCIHPSPRRPGAELEMRACRCRVAAD